MSLPVPLTVSIADKHVTAAVSAMQFRKEAVGGVVSINLTLSAPLSSLAVTAFDKCKVMDARTAEVIAEGRISDPGRTAGTDGQRYSVAAMGPATHADDMLLPLIYVDQSVGDGWRQVDRIAKAPTWTQSTKPGSTSDTAPECQVFQFPEGFTTSTLPMPRR